jgi:acyl carrier protein
MSTLERLSRILVQRYKLDPDRLTPEQPLGALGIDSLGMVEILFFIEEEFHVHLPSEGIAFGTLGEAANFIDGLIASQKGRSRQEAPGQPARAPHASKDPTA